MDLELPKPEFIRLDLFPALVVDKDDNILGDELRVIVTNDRGYLFYEGPTNQPTILSELMLTEFVRNGNKGYILTTEDSEYSIARAKNCGCGSRLRGFHPFLGVPYKRQT